MNNWEKIIEGYTKKPDNQTMKLITATVTSVTNDFYRADVRLITGQEISNLINQTPNKLHVGQNVEVGYRTTPEAGWIQIAHGEPDPMRQGGGGVQVENAVLFDANDLHEYTVTNELMVDISANTKLYYGAIGNIVVAQGIPCYIGSRTLKDSDFTNALDDLLTNNTEYLLTSYTGIVGYHYASGVLYRTVTDVCVYPFLINVDADSTHKTRWWFRIEATKETTNLNTSEVTMSTSTAEVNFYVSNKTDITDYGLLLVSQSVQIGSPTTNIPSTYFPYGSIGTGSLSNDYVTAMLVYKNSNPDVNKWNADYRSYIRSSGGYQTYTAINVGGVLPLSNAETIMAMGATQRSEPVTP